MSTPPAATSGELREAILNLPVKPYDGTDAYTHYCRGHADAIHAAAGLAASAAIPQAVTDAMVDAYLKANDAYWREVDALPTDPTKKWRQGTPKDATRESLRAALAASAHPARMLTDEELRQRWRDAGGQFHGPLVETGTMPEAILLPFLRALYAPTGEQVHPDTKRLTDERIHDWWASENGMEDFDLCKLEDFRKVVRAVEQKLAGNEGRGGNG